MTIRIFGFALDSYNYDAALLAEGNNPFFSALKEEYSEIDFETDTLYLFNCASSKYKFNDHTQASLRVLERLNQFLPNARIDAVDGPVSQGLLNDKTKISSLYAKMQKAAASHPNEPIVFDIFEGNLATLETWNQFFTFDDDNRNLIPSNVTLRLNKLEGNEVCSFAEFEGSGSMDELDESPDESAEILASVASGNKKDFPSVVLNGQEIWATPDLIASCLASPVQIGDLVQDLNLNQPEIEAGPDLENPMVQFSFFQSLDVFLQLALTWYEECKTHPEKAELLETAVNAAKELKTTLEQGAKVFFEDPLNPVKKEAFRKLCTEAMTKARPALIKDEATKKAWQNVGLAIGTLGIGFLIAGLINLACTNGRHFAFFTTKAETACDNFEDRVALMLQVGA